MCKTSKHFQGSISFDSSDSEPKPLAECNCILDYSGKNTSNSSPTSTAADSPDCPSYLDRPGQTPQLCVSLSTESLNFHATSPDHSQRSTHRCLCTTSFWSSSSLAHQDLLSQSKLAVSFASCHTHRSCYRPVPMFQARSCCTVLFLKDLPTFLLNTKRR